MPVLSKKILNKLGSDFFKMADLSQDIFWIRSSDFQDQLYVNPAYETIFKRSSQTIYNHSAEWINAVIVEDRDRLRQRFVEWQAEKPNLQPIEYRIRNTADEIHWLEDSVYPLYEGRKCIAYVGVAKDITHKKDRLKELDDASYSFRYFVDKIQSVFWVKDDHGKKQIYISPGYEKLWGLSCESLYADPASWLEVVLPEDREDGKIDLRFYDMTELPPDQKYEFKFRIRRPDGEVRWVKDTHFPVIEHGKVVGFAGVAEDITADVLKELELREAKENAEKANRAKADFLAMMSHELRTPLNAILGMTQILKASKLNEEQADQMEVIGQSGHHLLSLLNDLLDFAKLEVGKLSFLRESIHLPELVAKILVDLQPLADKKGLLLKREFADNIPDKIIGDPKRISQILINLVSNAIKFTEKGHVQVTISCLQKNHQEATICFAVEDTGIGIERSKLSTIFNRFQQVDSVYQRKHEGVGLGLAIVKELVEKMSGNIAVTSEMGVGSQFSCLITFPLQIGGEVKHEDLEDRAVLVVDNTRFNSKVLVVEDNLINQKISKTMLEQLGCVVDIASCGFEALEKVRDPYDMVFMDIGLPDMDGFEAARRIREAEAPGSHLPIIAMTAHVFAHDRERCFAVGMDEVIAKPIMQEELIKILKRWAPLPASRPRKKLHSVN